MSTVTASSTTWRRWREGTAPEASALLRPELAGLSRYHLDRSHARFKLDQNEPPWELPPEVQQRVAERWAKEAWNLYPDFHADDLRARLGELHGVGAERVLVGNGSNELLAVALTGLVQTGQEVLGFDPSFGLYRGFAAKAGAHYRGVPLGRDLALPVAALLAEVRRDPSRPVLLCTPNNPTGGALSVPEAEALLEALEAPLFLDNAYGEFCRHDYRPLLGRHPHLVLFRTFSKAWALAAARIGYLLAAAPVVEALIRVKLPYNLDRWSAIAAEEALAAAPFVEARVAELVAARDRWAEVLRRAGFEVFASEANFLLVRCGDAARAAAWFRRFAGAGVLLRDVGGYRGIEGCLRISIGSDEALRAVGEVIEGGLG
jgi:histidinol-phosphate aminotransferase